MPPLLPSPMQVSVAGVTFQDAYPAIAWRIQRALDEGRTITARLIREPDNPHDPNAIAVWVGKRTMLGHIPRNIARRMASEIDSGRKWRAVVESVQVHPDHPDNPGIWLAVDRR